MHIIAHAHNLPGRKKYRYNMESCLVCKSIVSTSKRRRLCNEASSHVLPLLGEWLEQIPDSPIACLKCFVMLEKVIRLRKSVKEVEDVLQSYLAPLTPVVTDATMTSTVTDGTCSISTQTDETFSASVHQSDSSGTPRLAVMSDSADSAFIPSTPKRRRACLQGTRLRLPTTGKSPSLAVSKRVLTSYKCIAIGTGDQQHAKDAKDTEESIQ